jgi:preprotein translocase subunit SecG
MNNSVLAAGFFMNVLLVIWIICSVALVLIVLIQKGKGGGLSGAFGGGMATNILGANTKKPLTWFTIGFVGVFLLLAILLAKFYPTSGTEVMSSPAPINQPVPPPTTRGAIPGAAPTTTPPAGRGGLPTGTGNLDMNASR